MSRRALIWIASATTVALVASLLAVIALPIADGGGATTALPGVPPSELRQQQIDVEPAHSADLNVPLDDGVGLTRVMIKGWNEISQVIPVRLRSERYPVYDGLAWAVVIDPANARGMPIIPACCPMGAVEPGDDYYVVFFDAECGHFLRVVAPGRDYDMGPTPAPLDSDREKHWTPYCPDIWD